MMFMGFFSLFCFFFIKAYVVGTHLNGIDKKMQFKWSHNICIHKEVDKKYTNCNLKTTELIDSTLIGVCVVIRANTDYFHGEIRK